MFNYGLVQKSIDCCACCSADGWLYTVYCYKGHYYRLTNSGLITIADEEDIKEAKRAQRRF